MACHEQALARRMAGRSHERYELSRTFRLRFEVGFPETKRGLPAFCISPIRFRIPIMSGLNVQPGSVEREADPADPFATVIKALLWTEELNRNSHLKRADIARREGISRARVTQLLQLAERGNAFWRDLRASGKKFSLRELLDIAKRAKGH
jgi:hypothetical protein